MQIGQVETTPEVAALSGLIAEYLQFVTADLEHHFGLRLDPGPLHARTMRQADHLVPPKGRCFVARDDAGVPFGMVLLRLAGEAGAAEIKRLYVRPGQRGTGAGRALVERALMAAREMGKSRVYLDTTRNLTGAIALYRKLGFDFTEAYPGSDHAARDDALAPYIVFMRRDLD